MDSAGFDSARWDHWLLIACFVAIAIYGLRSTWQLNRALRQQRAKAKLARRLAMEIHPSYLQPAHSQLNREPVAKHFRASHIASHKR